MEKEKLYLTINQVKDTITENKLPLLQEPRGIGRIAIEFAKHGANVAFTTIRP